MVSRRSLLISALATLPLRAVRAAPGDGIELRRGTAVEHPGRGAVVASRSPPAYDEIVRLGGRLRPRRVRVISRDNANARFVATFEVVGLGEDFAYLGIAGRWWAWSSTTTDEVSFYLDRDTAERVARSFGVAVELRERLDDGVALAWRIPATATVGAPVVAILRADNRGARPLRLAGGYEALEVAGGRDGELRVRGPNMYVGPLWTMPLPPRGHVEFAFALERLLEIDRPGRYVVSLRYRGQLTRGLEMPMRFDAARWDLDVAEQGAIDVA